ncbi:MAG: response regulator [Phocaeicola sp.]
MKRVFLLIIYLINTTCHLFAFSNNEYILCINSYTDAYPWSNRIIYQLTEYAQTQPNLSISVEHIQMLLVRNQKDFEGFKESLFEIYGANKPRVLILLGAPAFALRDKYREMWGDIPIILYSACNYVGEADFYFDENSIPNDKRIPILELTNEYNTTFFYSNLFLKENLDYIKLRHPQLESLIFIRDTRQINEDIETDLRTILAREHPGIQLLSFTPMQMNSNQLLSLLNNIDATQTAILFSSWFYINKTKRGESIVSNTNLLISTCKTPIFTLNLGDIITFGGGMHSGVTFDYGEFRNSFSTTLDKILNQGIEPRHLNSYYPTAGKPYVLCNIAFPRGLTYSDFPPETQFLNAPPSLFEQYKKGILACILIIGASSLFFFYRLRILKAKESITKELLAKQEQLIRELNIALKSASTVRWRRDESSGQVIMMDYNMNEVNITIDDSFQLVETLEEANKLQEFLKNLSDDKISSIVIHHKTPWDLRYKPYEVSAVAIRNDKGELTQAAYGVCRDISETYYVQKQLAGKVELLETIKECMPVGLSIYDKEGNLQSSNKAISQFLGIDTSRIACNTNLFIGVKDGNSSVEGLRRGESITIQRSYSEIEWIIKDAIVEGAPHGDNFEFRCTPILNAKVEIEGYVSICIDKTQDKHIQEELRIAKEKAEESGKLKTAFLANMSHEIRTPLNAIVGFSELLQHTEESAEKEEYIRIINSNNDLLLRLIGDILDLSKIESGLVELRMEQFDFSSFVNEAYSTLKPRCERSEVELQLHNPFSKCIVTLDKNRCLQIITNYLNNAVKFTTEGFIKMGYDYKENGLALFVQDTGIGIPEEKMDKLFQRFGKLDDFAQGTGLGLSICKAIAETMNGKVGVESSVGQGSIFWVWLPCEAQLESLQEVATDSPQRSINKGSKSSSKIVKNILVAEDNDSNYLLVHTILKGCNLTRAVNGYEALELAKQHKFDLILMDMKMPKMGGLEATKRIRTFDKETVIIAVTANAFDLDKVDALKVGCNSFIAKPIKRKELEAAISE